MTLVQGVVLFIFVKLISDFIGFTTISYLMNQVINYGAIAAVVIFAPELRSALETFGRTPCDLFKQELQNYHKQDISYIPKDRQILRRSVILPPTRAPPFLTFAFPRK